MTSWRRGRVWLRRLFVVCLLLGVAMLHMMLYPRSCRWPSGDANSGDRTTRIFLLADPQIMGDFHAAKLGAVGELDIAFNDWYYRHIVSSIVWWLRPSHTYVLGDLLSNESLDKREYDLRVERYRYMFASAMQGSTFVSIPGNHDIGYGAVLDQMRAARFEGAFGPLNSISRENGHILVSLNSMNIDESRESALRNKTLAFIDDVAVKRLEENLDVILFTHVPLHKPRGICADDPSIHKDRAGYVTQQNMLSPSASVRILDKLRPRYIFNGHDHVGCAYLHEVKASSYGPAYVAHEITVRSMMAEYGGHAELFEIIYDPMTGSYAYATAQCPFVTHVTVKVVFGSFFGSLVALLATLLLYFRFPNGDPGHRVKVAIH